MAPAAFWRAWSIWVVSVAAYVAGFGVFLVRFPRTLTLAHWLGFLYRRRQARPFSRSPAAVLPRLDTGVMIAMMGIVTVSGRARM